MDALLGAYRESTGEWSESVGDGAKLQTVL